MGINNSLLKSIQTIVDKAIEIAPFDKTRQAQVVTNNMDSTYTVRLDGILYNNVPSYPKTNMIEVGAVVKIVMPSNQSSQMYIQSSKGGGGNGGHIELTQAEYDALTPSQQTDGTVYFITDGATMPRELLDFCHPVGKIIQTVNTNFDPNVSLGGVWRLLPEGTVILSGSDNGTYRVGNDTSTSSKFKEYGENTHTLTINEMPAHEHEVKWEHSYLVSLNKGSSGYGYALNWGTPEGNGRLYGASIGGGQAHNIMQKSIAMYTWIRMA